MPVQFKFRGEKAFRGLLNVTTPCTLQRVKNAIYEQAQRAQEREAAELERAKDCLVISAGAAGCTVTNRCTEALELPSLPASFDHGSTYRIGSLKHCARFPEEAFQNGVDQWESAERERRECFSSSASLRFNTCALVNRCSRKIAVTCASVDGASKLRLEPFLQSSVRSGDFCPCRRPPRPKGK